MLDTNIEPVRWAKVPQLRVLSQLLRIVDLGKKKLQALDVGWNVSIGSSFRAKIGLF